MSIENNVQPEADRLFNNENLAGAKELSLHFSSVSYVCKKSKAKNLQILDNVCGSLQAGRLAAILGPSGAGKTSMLNVLSGFKAKGVSGQFELNNEKRDLLTFRKISTYIPQDFAMLDLLTVQETLRVSTDLKLTTATSSEEKDQIDTAGKYFVLKSRPQGYPLFVCKDAKYYVYVLVERNEITDILRILNMETCRHSLVHELSGGERKRLSIGIELVSNPPVMFFDEPTSGLDSVASLQLINYLRRLAQDGRIIVCVVHQPSSRLMQLFDDIFVMSHGRMLYAGSQREMLQQFELAGFRCPNYYNPADFVLEVASEEHDEKILKLIQQNQSKFGREPQPPNRIILPNLNDTGQAELEHSLALEPLRTNNEISLDIGVNEKTIEIVQMDIQNQNIVRPKERVSFCQQFSVLFCRTLRSMSRNLISVQLRIIMHIVVGALLGLVFWNIGNDASKALTNSSCILFVVMFVFFGNAMPSILLCPQETAVFLREYLNSWYSVRAYYAAKIVADLPMQFICPTCFILIVYFMTGQPAELARLAMCWGICFLTAFIGHFIGLAFGSTFDLQMSVFLVPGITIPFLIFSGFFIRLHELSAYLRPLCDISFFRYTMEGFMQAIYGYERSELNCQNEPCYYKSPEKFLKDFDMHGDRYGADILALFIFIIVLKVLFYLSLIFRIHRVQ